MRVVLATVNARYHHCSLALRYLKANLGEFGPDCQLLEFTLEQRPLEVVEALLAARPDLIGLSIYIWNASFSLEVVRLLKRLRPDLPLVLGGPEVSYEWDQQELVALADYLITHEGERALLQLCRDLSAGRRDLPRVIAGGQPRLDDLVLPYDLYSDVDLAQRTLYVEASRGCPFRCEFCLSSLDTGVRYFPQERLLAALQQLLDRGARHFKFIDRTFNLRLEVSSALLDFFWQRYQPDMFLHFEMVPDRFPAELRSRVARFPAGAVQFEIGIQTFQPEVQQRISRRQKLEALEDNLRFLREHTGVHIHADLIVGLPGETLEQFARGFDHLVALGPQEIQVGILKRLRGTPILRHDQEFAMLYSPSPPYEILQNSVIDFDQMMRLKRFARMWDVTANRGRFPQLLRRLLGQSPFENFMAFSLHAVAALGGTREMAVDRVARCLVEFLLQQGHPLEAVVADALADYGPQGRIPGFLSQLPGADPEWFRRALPRREKTRALPARQARHLEAQPVEGLLTGVE